MYDLIYVSKDKKDILDRFKKKYPEATFEDASSELKGERCGMTFSCRNPDVEYFQWLEQEGLQDLSHYYRLTKSAPRVGTTMKHIPLTPAYPR